jgi:hypothetical protein
MKIVGSQVYLKNTLPPRSPGDLGAESRERSPVAQPSPLESPVVLDSPASGQPSLSRDVTRISGLTASAKRFSLYENDPSPGGTATQQKAVNLYQQNQNLSRIDSNIDFLGSIDTFA